MRVRRALARKHRRSHAVACGLRLAPSPVTSRCKLPDSQLEPVKWADVEGWAADDQLAAFAAYQTSCQPFRKVKRPRDERPVVRRALGGVPARGCGAAGQRADAARAFFEENFRPVRIAQLGERGRLSDRLLRADRAGFALSQSGIPRPALSAAAATSSPPATSRVPTTFPTRACRSDAATKQTRSCPITIAARSRKARSTARSSKSAGSRIRSKRWRFRSRGRRA